MHISGCKHELDFTVPVEEIDRETERAVANLQKKVRLPGFRPGKAPASLVRTRFANEVRQDVLESLIPKHLEKRFKEQELKVVGSPSIRDLHFEKGEPLRFKAEFEVAPEVPLETYKGLTVHYTESQVSDEDVNSRLEQVREQKAQFVTIEPRAAADGDYALVSLDSVSGVEPAMHQDEMTIHVGDPETLAVFSDAVRGMSPDEEKEFDVEYPEDYGSDKLAGKTVRFRMKVKALRRKELPELNDEFAKDLGDFNSIEEVRNAIHGSILRERESAAQQKAKEEAIDRLVEAHDFAVPEAFIDKQIENEVEGQFRRWSAQGLDVSKLKLDWERIKEAQRPKAVRDVKASLLLDKVAEREGIETTQEELDREVQRIAREQREPIAAVRKKLEQDGTLRRIASHIRTEKTLNLLFEHARKEAGEYTPPSWRRNEPEQEAVEEGAIAESGGEVSGG